MLMITIRSHHEREINHIATGMRAPMENYSLLIMGEGDGDEDGFGGNSPSR